MQTNVRQDVKDAVRVARRRAAVAAAMEAFAENGFHDAAMTDIARRSGLSLKALYESFDSKEDLFTAVIRDVWRRFRALFAPNEGRADAAQLVLDRAQRMLDLLGENPGALGLYLRGRDGIPASMQQRGFDPYSASTDRLITATAKLIKKAQAKPGTPRLDPLVVARAIQAIVLAEARRRLEGAPSADVMPLVAVLLGAS